MNGFVIEKTKSDSENNVKSVAEGITICINCGSIHSTILKKALYCRDCRDFRLFTKKTQEGPVDTGHYDDDD